MFKAIAALLLLCSFATAQEVTISDRPEAQAYTKLFVYSGNVLSYSCTARSLQAPSRIAVSTISNANPGVATATAHGIPFVPPGTTGAHIVVVISGATGNWTPINGTHVLTPVTANTFNLDVNTTSFGAWGSQSITVTTRAPLTTQPVWTVKSYVSDASGNLGLVAYQANSTISGLSNLGSGTTGGTTCSSPAAYQ